MKTRFRPAFFFAILISLIFGAAADGRVYLMKTEGAVWIEGSRGRRIAKSGTELDDGERIVTGTTGRAEALLADASTIVVNPRSIVRVEGSGASTSSVSIQKGMSLIKSSAYRWGTEALQISTPVATSGVRGTEFSVVVAESGEALFFVEHGVVSLPGGDVSAGQSASLLYRNHDSPVLHLAPPAIAAWTSERYDELAADPGAVVNILTELIREAIGVRIKAVFANLGTIRDLLNALKVKEEGDRQQRSTSKILRVIDALKNGIENVRTIWRSDRELWLRESVLQALMETSLLKPGQKFAANFAIKFAENDARSRIQHLKQANKALSNLSAATVFLAGLAASDPDTDRTSSRLIEEGLGIPLRAGAAREKDIRITSDDLGWVKEQSWRMMRTIRGREDFRVPVNVTVRESEAGLQIERRPLAFDTTYTLHVRRKNDQYILEDIEGGQYGSKENKKILPFLLYDFPLETGKVWEGWRSEGRNPAVIERRVTNAERVTIGDDSYDALRIETRWYGPRRKISLLINVEWIAPQVGQIREMTFRGELGALEWDERIP